MLCQNSYFFREFKFQHFSVMVDVAIITVATLLLSLLKVLIIVVLFMVLANLMQCVSYLKKIPYLKVMDIYKMLLRKINYYSDTYGFVQ